MTDQLLAVIAFVGMAVSMLALGVRIGRRQGWRDGRDQLINQTHAVDRHIDHMKALDEALRESRRRALSQHHCPPRFTTEQLFATQAREWEHRAGIDIKRHLGGSR